MIRFHHHYLQYQPLSSKSSVSFLRCSHQLVVPLLYFPFGALGKRMVCQMGEEAKAAGFPCGCKADPDTRDVPHS